MLTSEANRVLVHDKNGPSSAAPGQGHRKTQSGQHWETQQFAEHGPPPPVPEKDDIYCQAPLRPPLLTLDPTNPTYDDATRYGHRDTANDSSHKNHNDATGSPGSHSSSLSSGAGHRQSYNGHDLGSPVKQQSPLRQSISYEDYSDSESLASSFRASVEFANTLIGRTAMSYTGDKKVSGRVSLDRSSPPYRRAQTEEPPSRPTVVSPPTRQVRSQTVVGPQTPSKSVSPVGSSRFAFFSSSISALKGATTASSSSPSLNPMSVPHDELMNLDINAALQSREGDAFSPAAYKNLQMTAKGLLEKFQAAYQQRTVAYQELKAERNAQTEEQDEAETRMHHLKMQLEGMARRAAEQEAMMQSLVEELARERRARSEEQQSHQQARTKVPLSMSGGSSVSEDLGVDEDLRRREWRRSAGTAKSDLGCDTDEESLEEASVFSRSRSPTINTTITEASHTELHMIATAPTPFRTSMSSSTLTTPPPRYSSRSGLQQQQQQQSQPQMSAFQKLFKGIASDGSPNITGLSSCRNCEGQEASVAWDTVNLLKDENRGLKERVSELEDAVEGAMDLVNGVAVRGR